MDWRENALERAAGHQARLKQLFGTCVRHLSSDQVLPKHAHSPIFSTTLPNLWICPFCFHRNQSPLTIPPSLTTTSRRAFHSVYDHRPRGTSDDLTLLSITDDIHVRGGHLHDRGGDGLPQVCLITPQWVPLPLVLLSAFTSSALARLRGPASRADGLRSVSAGAKDGLSSDIISRFLLPASQCEFTLNSVLEELQKDPRPVPSHQRASRCTSTAFSVATCLLGACVPGSGARIMAFIGGPST